MIVELVKPYLPQLIAALLTAVIAIITHVARARVKLIYSQRAQFFQNIPTPSEEKPDAKVRVNSESLSISNAGKMPAEEVEFILNYKPDALSVWPQREYNVNENPEKKYIVKFSNIAPKEIFFVDITCVDRPLPNFLGVRNKQCTGKLVSMSMQRDWPSYMSVVSIILMLVGFISIFSFLIKFIIHNI